MTDTPDDELGVLEDILNKLTNFHSVEKAKAPAAGFKLPNFQIPNIQIPTAQARGGLAGVLVSLNTRWRRQGRAALELPARLRPQLSLPPENAPSPQTTATPQINELLRKGAEDAQSMIKQAGHAAHDAFEAAVDMHKKYAPKPKEGPPVEVSAALRDK